ncbi:MAG: GNAT family N-acetyltransferase [Pseudomonadota bacterium]|nr:GNAT family N-acetyltransferase [Pseudomonadota bacterium]
MIHQAGFAELDQATWDSVVPRSRRAPMHLRDWAKASLDSYSDRANARVLVVGAASAPDALIPLMRRPGPEGWFSLVGNEGGGVEVPYRTPEAVPLIARALVGLGHPVTLGDYPIHSPLVAALRDAARGRAFVVTQPLDGPIKPWLDLDDTWREPLGCIKKKLAQSIRRRHRRLEELGELEVVFLTPTPEEVDQLLDTALALEASGWKAKAGIALATDPKQAQFYRAYCTRLSELGRLHLTFLKLDGRPLAMSVGELYGGTYWAHKTGYDEAYAKFAPGILKQYRLVKHLAESGVQRIDFQGRLDDFKRTWTDHGVQAAKVRIYPFNARGVLAMACDTVRQARRTRITFSR